MVPQPLRAQQRHGVSIQWYTTVRLLLSVQPLPSYAKILFEGFAGLSAQAPAARRLKESLDVAFELIEVRTGLGLKPEYGGGGMPQGTREAVGNEMRKVIDKCRGEVGKEKRRNAQRLKDELAEAWGEEGVARAGLRRFLGKYLSKEGGGK